MINQIKKMILDEGFGDCGFIPFSLVKDKLFDTRNKALLPETPKTVIIAILPYYQGDRPERNISLYAVGTDYHKIELDKLNNIVKKLKTLYPDNSFAAFADNSPIPEVYAAQLSGIGVRGSNNLLITKKYGSFVNICDIVTDLEIPGIKVHDYQKCSGCGKCVKACPTGALCMENGSVRFDKTRCISFLNQKKSLTYEEKELIKNSPFVWGCDICQLACPQNANTPVQSCESYKNIWKIERKDIADLSEAEYQKKYGDRSYAYKGKDILLRNIELRNI